MQATIQRDLIDVDRRITNLVNALANGGASIAPIRAGIADLEAQKAALAAKLAELDATGDQQKRRGWLEAARSRLERTANLFRRIREREIPASEEFRAILGELLARVALAPEGEGYKLVVELGKTAESAVRTDLVPREGLDTPAQAEILEALAELDGAAEAPKPVTLYVPRRGQLAAAAGG